MGYVPNWAKAAWAASSQGCTTAWGALGSHHEQIKIIFAAIAAIIVVAEYINKKDEAKIKQTMEFQTRFGNDDIQKAYLDLNFMLLDKKAEIKGAGANASAKIAELVKDNDYERNLIQLADFFGQIVTCVENSVCDKKVACASFSSPVIAFRNNFNRVFEDWKREWGENFIASSYGFFAKGCK